MAFLDLGKPKSKLGIDIGTASIKIAEMSKEAGRFNLENYGLFELKLAGGSLTTPNHPSLKATQLSNQDLVWGIREVLSRSKMNARDVVASIPSFSTFTTVITMPYLSEKDLAKTIPFEARKYVPLPLDEIVLDWSIINIASQRPRVENPPTPSRASQPTSVEIFLAAVPREETEKYRDIMKLAGLNLRALELENSALIRALLGNDLGPVAVVNIGGRSTAILIVDNGYERISHNYEVGGFEITKSISKSLNISLGRAEELKRSFGVGEADSSVIKEAMSSLLDMMAFETKKTIHGYEEAKNVKIGKVIMVGGLANMPNFTNYFGAKLGLPLVLGNPLARVVVPPALDRIKGELNSTFAIAIGLAMREI